MQPTASPHLTAEAAPARPRMFATRQAKGVWVLVPVTSLGLLSALPFVVAAAKGVVRPVVPVLYGVATVLCCVPAAVVDAARDKRSLLPALLVVLLMAASSTHTALLDTGRVRLGRRRPDASSALGPGRAGSLERRAGG